ncbi:hypothetical protein CEXT_711211 [Caerostris extrusa]|uniref:Uncharacterized protein n=1 Tax=Caerostris extrusa TaxID=172846 RepID=A0AAV4PSW1_CAEEX|nr:hypothetical protein CEXT_711211 [Caerostris extrusa]
MISCDWGKLVVDKTKRLDTPESLSNMPHQDYHRPRLNFRELLGGVRYKGGPPRQNWSLVTHNINMSPIYSSP